MTLELTLFTDPACPFAFSAEPVRWRLRWHYRDQLQWNVRMIVLTLEPGEAEALAEGSPDLQRRYGMPIHPGPSARPASCEPACRAIVAVREHAPGREHDLLRRIRMRVMAGGLIDDPDLLEAAALDAGIDPAELTYWSASAATETALQDDIAAARTPNTAARALDHKLGGPRSERRYPAPSYVLRRADGTGETTIAGFNPPETYESAIANLAPELERRPRPESVAELLTWAGEPLATAEIAMVTGLSGQQARGELSRVARAIPVGADAYWIPPAA